MSLIYDLADEQAKVARLRALLVTHGVSDTEIAKAVRGF